MRSSIPLVFYGFLIPLAAWAQGTAPPDVQPPAPRADSIPAKFTGRDAGLPLLDLNDSRLFLLNKGILMSLDPDTLKTQGTLNLFGPAPDFPPGQTLAPEEYARRLRDAEQRLLPSAMSVAGPDLLTMVGDRFTRIQAADFTPVVNVPIVNPDRPSTALTDAFERSDSVALDLPLSYRLESRKIPDADPKAGTHMDAALTAINSDDGTTAERVPLPRALSPETWFPTSGLVENQNLPVTLLKMGNALVALRAGGVAKFDAKTLAVQHTVELFGPPPDKPDKDTVEAWLPAAAEVLRRSLPGTLAPDGDRLWVLLADHLFMLDADSLGIRSIVRLQPTPASNKAQSDRMRILTALGQPQAVILGPTLFAASGNKVLAFNTADGTRKEVTLPTVLLQPLPEARLKYRTKAEDPVNPLPREGDEITILGYPRKYERGLDTYHTVVTFGRYEGQFLLYGPLVSMHYLQLSDSTDQVEVTGKFHKAEPGLQVFGLGAIEVESVKNAPEESTSIEGVIGVKTYRNTKVWMFTTSQGLDLVLFNEKARDLSMDPAARGHRIVVDGVYYSYVEDVRPHGDGYLSVNDYQVIPNPDEAAAADDRLDPLFLTGSPNGLLVYRKGFLACFDAASLEQTGLIDLFPDLPVPPAAGLADPDDVTRFNYHRWQRSQPVFVAPWNGDTVVVAGGRYLRLDNKLQIKSQLTLFPDGPPPTAVKLEGNHLAAIYPYGSPPADLSAQPGSPQIAAVNLTVGTQVVAPIPDRLTQRLLP